MLNLKPQQDMQLLTLQLFNLNSQLNKIIIAFIIRVENSKQLNS